MITPKDILKRVRGSGEGSTVAANFGYLTLLQIAGSLFPFITMPYVARVVGADGFGQIAFALAVTIWFQTITDWGFNYTATREVAQCRDDHKKVEHIFSRTFWARIVLMGISFVVLLIMIATIPMFRDSRLILLATFLQVPGQILYPEWFFQAMEKMKYITWLTLLAKLLFAASVFIFIQTPDDYVLQPLLIAGGMTISGVLSLWIIIRRWGFRLHRVPLTEIKTSISDSFNVFLNNLMPALNNSLTIVILNNIAGSRATGIYDAGSKFGYVSNQLLGSATRATYPYLARHGEKHTIIVALNMMLATAAAAVLFIIAPWLVGWFFSAEYAEGSIVLRIIAITLIFQALNNSYGLCYLILQGHERLMRNLSIVATAVSVLAAFPLITAYSYVGAAIALAISQFIIGIGALTATLLLKRRQKK
ncbi:MAG: flippase [Bacteroidales bacterium]|nr:flippase [Bacteroidales bacterium]